MIRMRLMTWFKRFVDPIILPDGRELLTLRDGPEMLARIAVTKALKPNKPR